MAFLTIGNHTIGVFNATPRKTLSQKGKGSRSHKGQFRDTRRNVRRAWRMDACFHDFDKAETLEGVINGLGHYVGFTDGFEASTGLNPEPNFGAFILDLSQSVTGKNITGVITSGGDTAFTLSYDAQLIGEWSVQWREFDGATWYVVTERSDGAIWVDGVRNDLYVSLATMNVAAGVVTFTDANGDLESMADVALLPYLASETFIVSWHSSDERFSPLPVLRTSGDIIEESTIWTVGQVLDSRYIQKPEDIPGIGWLNNAKSVTFEIAEMNEAFIADDLYIQS